MSRPRARDTWGIEILHDHEVAEIVNLYHLAKTALAGPRNFLPGPTHYSYVRWAIDQWLKENPDTSAKAAWRAMEREFAWKYGTW